MNEVATIQTGFNFEVNGVETLDLATLRRTHRENNIYDEPVRGYYHFQVIDKVEEMCRKYNLNYRIEEIFAAQNKNKTQPGVVVLPQVEATFGPKAVEAHILRRIFTTIQIRDCDTDELTTTIALAIHQNGIQAAIGPCVIVCHNQCILRPESMVADYGKGKVSTEQVFETIDGWLHNFHHDMAADHERINRLRKRKVSMQELYTYIGLLTAMRVAHDSEDKALSSKVDVYPLNSGQISKFVESVLQKQLANGVLTAWDIYNVATELYKPDSADIPTLIPQNGAFAATLFEFCDGKTN